MRRTIGMTVFPLLLVESRRAAGLRLQPARRSGRRRGRRVERDRQPAATTQRSRAESRCDRERLRRPRARSAHPRHRGAQSRRGRRHPGRDDGGIERALRSALARLLVVAEQYPNLKADQNFLQTAGRARGHGESAVGRAHALQRGGAQPTTPRRRAFPTLITARIFGFAEKPYFEAPSGAKEAPKVEF